MKTICLLFACLATAFAFGPHSVPLITKTTTPPIDCDGRPSPFTLKFCEYKPNKMYRHPNSPKWFISCGGGVGVKGICQRCDPHAQLELNEDCQMCLYPGQKCPKKLPAPAEWYCPDDGCPFCPNDDSVNGGYTYHRNARNFCQCVWGSPKCLPCPCQQIFDRKKKCCVNHEKGRICPTQ